MKFYDEARTSKFYNKHSSDVVEALLNACERGTVDDVSALLEAEPDINSRRPLDIKTPLAIACTRGDIDIVKLLLERGADTDIPDRNGMTAFMSAASRGHGKVVDLMVATTLERQSGNKTMQAIQNFRSECSKYFKMSNMSDLDAEEKLNRIFVKASRDAVNQLFPGVFGGERAKQTADETEQEEAESKSRVSRKIGRIKGFDPIDSYQSAATELLKTYLLPPPTITPTPEQKKNLRFLVSNFNLSSDKYLTYPFGIFLMP